MMVLFSLGIGIPPSDALIRYLWRSALPSGTALRKPGTARLQQAYSPALCRAIPMDGLSIPCSERRNPRSPAAFLFLWGGVFWRAQAEGRISLRVGHHELPSVRPLVPCINDDSFSCFA